METRVDEDFDYKGCIEWLDICIHSYEKTKDIPIIEISKFLREFCKVFRKMGKLLTMAFSDVEDKVNIMLKHNSTY